MGNLVTSLNLAESKNSVLSANLEKNTSAIFFTNISYTYKIYRTNIPKPVCYALEHVEVIRPKGNHVVTVAPSVGKQCLSRRMEPSHGDHMLAIKHQSQGCLIPITTHLCLHSTIFWEMLQRLSIRKWIEKALLSNGLYKDASGRHQANRAWSNMSLAGLAKTFVIALGGRLVV